MSKAFFYKKEDNPREAIYYEAEEKEAVRIEEEAEEGKKPKLRRKTDKYKKWEWSLGEEARSLLLAYLATTYNITEEEAGGLLSLYLLEVSTLAGNKWRYRILGGLEIETMKEALKKGLGGHLYEVRNRLEKKNTKGNFVKMFDLLSLHMEREGRLARLYNTREKEKRKGRNTGGGFYGFKASLYYIVCEAKYETHGSIFYLSGISYDTAKATTQP